LLFDFNYQFSYFNYLIFKVIIKKYFLNLFIYKTFKSNFNYFDNQMLLNPEKFGLSYFISTHYANFHFNTIYYDFKINFYGIIIKYVINHIIAKIKHFINIIII